jgi:hypothetical protein
MVGESILQIIYSYYYSYESTTTCSSKASPRTLFFNVTQTSGQDNTYKSPQQQCTAVEPERAQDDNDEPLLKKPPLEEHERSADTETRLSPFLNLPLELLAEILILAVARSRKFLCATLLNPSSTFI